MGKREPDWLDGLDFNGQSQTDRQLALMTNSRRRRWKALHCCTSVPACVNDGLFQAPELHVTAVFSAVTEMGGARGC